MISIEKAWNSYYDAVGRLVHACGRLEDSLNLTLTLMIDRWVHPPKYYKLTWPDPDDANGSLAIQRSAWLSMQREAIIKVMLAEKSIEHFRHLTKKLQVVVGTSKKSRAEIERIFVQLGELQNLRNRIAHNGAEFHEAPDIFMSSNANTVGEGEKIDRILFTPAILLKAARDLNVMPDLIYNALDPEIEAGMLKDPHYQKMLENPDMKAHLEDLHGPWHYKSAELIHLDLKPQPTVQKPKRPHQSSPARSKPARRT